MMSDTEDEDPRFGHIKNTMLKLLNVDNSHWKELIWKEENQTIINDFLDTPTTNPLLIFMDQNEKLVLSLEILTSRYIPLIMACFLKSSAIISTENYKQEIMFGNVCNLPLSQYRDLFGKVLYPIFSNSLNNKRWPEDIRNDIILHFQDFRKTLTYHVGLAQGKTVLVIPEIARMIDSFNIDEINSENIDWKLQCVINAIIDMLSDWIPVIKEVLEVTSETILRKVQQGPITEIKFWNDRKRNLEFIQRQLNDPIIDKMVLALEKTNSHHFPLFKNLLQQVVEALDEANEISNSLSAMSDVLQQLETCEFFKLKENLPEAMKTITSSWTSSKYFNRVPSRISVLIKKSCFFLIEKVEEFLVPSKLFKGNECEMKEKIKVSIETCNIFLKSYYESRENYSQDDKIYPWEFPDQRVFDSFEEFLRRLNKIYEIFEASELYCSIPNYKILGVQQVKFKIRLDELSTTFKECYKVFVESTYNPLDLKSDVFLQDYDMFSLKVNELDHKLGIALYQVCISCITSEESFQLMNLIQDLLKRPLVNLEFKKIITSLIRNIYIELLAAKENYEKLLLVLESKDQIIYKNLPHISGELQWSIDLQKKLSFPIDSLQQLQQYYINAEDADLILRTNKQMEELLSNFQREISNKWKIAADIVNKQLDETLFLRDENNLLLNFSSKIFDFAQEIQHVKMIKKSDLLPVNALEFHDKLKNILFAYSLLACTIRWYNDLAKNLKDFERVLIKEEWEQLHNDLEKGLEEKWTKSDIQEYSENVYTITKSLYERINQAKENVKEVQKFIESWNKSPVFVRDTPDSLVNFEMFMTSRMHQQVYNVIETTINMNRVMEENVLLFKSDSEFEEWKNYMLYLDSIIEIGLKDSIKCSLEYLVENTNEQNKKLVPFYKIKMILEEDISFVPSLDRSQQGSLFKLLQSVIENIYCPASKIKQLSNTETDYLGTISENVELNALKYKLIQQVESGIDKTLAQIVNYQHYSDIWLKDIDAALEDFILYGPLPDTIIDEEEEDSSHTEILSEIKPPTEEEFRTQIAQFDMLQKKIDDIPSEILVESWLLLDTTSFKESLSLLIRNWSSAYKKKLVELKSQDKLRKVEVDGD